MTLRPQDEKSSEERSYEALTTIHLFAAIGIAAVCGVILLLWKGL